MAEFYKWGAPLGQDSLRARPSEATFTLNPSGEASGKNASGLQAQAIPSPKHWAPKVFLLAVWLFLWVYF